MIGTSVAPVYSMLLLLLLVPWSLSVYWEGLPQNAGAGACADHKSLSTATSC
jgi:hypothetical protein